MISVEVDALIFNKLKKPNNKVKRDSRFNDLGKRLTLGSCIVRNGDQAEESGSRVRMTLLNSQGRSNDRVKRLSASGGCLGDHRR